MVVAPLRKAPTPRRVGVVADLLEEHWPSMDLVADMLFARLKADGGSRGMRAELLRPTLTPEGSSQAGSGGFDRTFDRFVHRYWDYSRWLRRRARAFDVFHVIDHSYAHLVHVLPAHKTIVTCHDVDAFLSLVEPALTTSKLPNILARVVLAGMRKAAYVTCDSIATFDDIRRYNLVPAERLVVVPNGTHAAFSAESDPVNDLAIGQLLGAADEGTVDLLHVGSTIPRKRIDVLLRVVAAVREACPGVRLLKAGGTFTDEQRALVRSLELERSIVELPFLRTEHLAALYRRAAMVLVTSDREGFGLPVAEAMACGTPVVATDLAVLREVGGRAGVYCPRGDVSAWADAVLGLLFERQSPAATGQRRRTGIDRARTFTWEKYASAMGRLYERVATGVAPGEDDERPIAV
jgi:glycosyltransferase involved in cell wall biosynthesis